MNRITLFCLQVFIGVLLLASLLTSLPAFARAGTLLKCDFVFTSQGYRYVGTYCMDYECKYVERLIFESYCPFMRP